MDLLCGKYVGIHDYKTKSFGTKKKNIVKYSLWRFASAHNSFVKYVKKRSLKF